MSPQPHKPAPREGRNSKPNAWSGWMYAVIMGLTLGTHSLSAVTVTWDGSVGTGAWGTGANWDSGSRPASGDDVVFDANAANSQFSITPGANRTIRGLTFTSTGSNGFTFNSGNQITVTAGGITNSNAATQTFNADVRINADQTWAATTGDLDFNNVLINRNLILTGSNNFDISGTLTAQNNRSITNNGTGAFTINDIDLSANSNRLLTISGSNDTTISGLISNAGRIRKQGTGTLTISGANTYTGTTLLNGGTVVIGDNSSFGTGQIDFNNIILDGGGVARNIANDSRLVNTLRFGGTSDIELSGNMTLTNNRNIYADGTGTYEISGDIALSSNTNATNRTLIVRGANDLTISGDISNGTLATAGKLTKNDAGTLTLSGTNTYDGITDINTGTVVITGDNSGLSGQFRLDNGDVQVGAANAFGTGELRLANGDISGIGAARTITNDITLAGNGTIIEGSQDLDFTGTMTLSGNNRTMTVNNTGATTFSGDIALADNATSRRFTLNGTTDTTLSGDITNGSGGATAGQLTINNTGTTTISGTNTYDGTTDINNGTVIITGENSGISGQFRLDNGDVHVGAANAFGTGELRLAAGDIRAIGSARTVTNDVTLGGSGTIIEGALDLTFTGTTTLNGNRTVNVTNTGLTTLGDIDLSSATINRTFTLTHASGSDIVIDGVISNGLSSASKLTKNGTGTLTLTGDNTYTGVTTVNAGTLKVGDGGTSGSLTSNIVNKSAVIFDRSNDSTYANIISSTGTVEKTGTGNLTFSGDNTYTGATTVANGTLTLAHKDSLGNVSSGTTVNSGATLSLTNNIAIGAEAITNNGTVTNTSGTNTYAGVMSGTGNLTVTADQLTLTGANTYTGDTTINAGTLGLGVSNALADSTAVTVAGSGTLDLDNNSDTVGSIAGGGNITLGSGTLTTGGDNTSTIFSGVISETGNLIKTGTGDLTFSGANTYTGATTVSDGTLTLANSAALGTAAAGTTVDSGAILALTNNITVAGEAITNNGTVTNTSGTNTFNGVISGTGIVTTTGGNLTLGATNSYSGNTTVGTGTTLTLSANNALGTGNTTVNSGGTLALTGGITVDQTTNTLAGTGNAAVGAIRNLTGDNRLTGNFSLSGATTIQSDAGTLNLGTTSFDTDGYRANVLTNNGNALTVTGSGDTNLFSGLSGTGNLVKNDSGTLTVTGVVDERFDDRFTGEVIINDGVLIQATFDNNDPGVGPLDDFGINGNITIGDGTGATSSATLRLGTNDAGGTIFRNMIAGGVDVTVNSDGYFDTRGHKTFVQNVTLDGGSINAQTATLTGEDLFITGDITSTSTSQTATIDGFVNFNADATKTINVATDSTLDINARVQNGGIEKTGAGTLILSGGNSYTDNVDIQAGIIRVDNNAGLGTINGTTTVQTGAQLQLDGVTIGAEALTLNGTGISNTGALQTVASSGANSWAGNVTVASTSEIEVSSGSSLAITGNVTGSGKTLTIESIGNTTLSGTNTLNTLNKTGAGSLTVLTSPNTISTVNVSAGTFTVGTSNILNDSLDLNVTGTGTFAMAGGINDTIDQLDSSGTLDVDGILTMNGGTISGGSGAGSTGELILTANNTLNITSDYDFGGTLELTSDTVLALAGDGNQIDIGALKVTGDTVIDFGDGENIELNLGSLTIATGTTITVNNWNSFQDLWTTGSFTGGTGSVTIDERDTNTAQITFNGFSSSDTIWLTLDFGSNEITVPEPSSYGALLIGFGLAGWILRRRRRIA